MTVIELINALTNHPMNAEVYVDLQKADCLEVEGVDAEEDDGGVVVYLVVSV